jgi:alkanesulfonate monooxygenase
MSERSPRFGIWAQTEGTWHSLHHPDDPFDASWVRNRDQVLEAEALGYETTLLAQHTINPYGDHREELEPWTGAAALSALTERIEIIVAIKPYLYHPVVLAKMALQIEEISQGRAAINVVNAWYRPELEKSGIGFAEHDERYAYGTEWLTIVKSLISGRRTTFHGRYFDVDDYVLRPGSQWRERPRVYVGGESEPARNLVSSLADVWFINGKPLEQVSKLIGDVAARQRVGPPVHFGLSAFVIARDTDEEAAEELAYLFELAEADKPEVDHLLSSADPNAVMFQTHARHLAVGTNGGTAAGLVGSYDTVARRIGEFHDAGIETFMLQFQPFEPEMRRFAHEVAPRARRLALLAS